MILCAAGRQRYIIVRKDDRRNPFSMRSVKNGPRSSKPIVFEDENSAKYMRDVLDISIITNGTWEDAIELRDDELFVSEDVKRVLFEDCIDFCYCEVKKVCNDQSFDA